MESRLYVLAQAWLFCCCFGCCFATPNSLPCRLNFPVRERKKERKRKEKKLRPVMLTVDSRFKQILTNVEIFSCLASLLIAVSFRCASRHVTRGLAPVFLNRWQSDNHPLTQSHSNATHTLWPTQNANNHLAHIATHTDLRHLVLFSAILISGVEWNLWFGNNRCDNELWSRDSMKIACKPTSLLSHMISPFTTVCVL